jgi:soluble lytic murein transglycosylase
VHTLFAGALFPLALVGAACSERSAEALAAADTLGVATAEAGPAQPVTIPPGVRELVLQAREHDRLNRRDSAREAYLEAARQLPRVSDWLLLRAAGVTPSADDRARLYARVRTAVARDRVSITEAFARERSGDIAGAITEFERAGAPISAFRLRFARAGDGDARAELRRELLQFITANQGTELGRDALAFFDQSFALRTAQEELILARAAAAAGRAARAVSGYVVATRAGLGTGQDYFTYGTMLARSGRHADAASQYARVTEPASLAAAAQYQLARMRIATGNASAATATLRLIATRWPADTSAASALMLLADLATDQNRDQAARETLLDVARRFPEARHAPAAGFRAALLAYVHGQPATAAREFRSAAERYPDAADAAASRYWAGRALHVAGDRAAADSMWRQVMVRDPGSYYTVLAARRLRTQVPIGRESAQNVRTPPAVDSALVRAALLDSLGMAVERRHEFDRLFRDAGESPEQMLATAEAFSGTEQATRAITLGWRLINEVGRNPRTYRIVYPVLERERIIEESRTYNLDPVLVASLIRQESNFNPRATSPAGARGLMQIMPAVGRQLAARRGVSGYTPEMLYDPATNLALGTLHLRNMLTEYPNLEQALAAYNAGGSRVRRWRTKAGTDDPEVFTERIPFVETRGYVRAIVRNRAFYQALYPW